MCAIRRNLSFHSAAKSSDSSAPVAPTATGSLPSTEHGDVITWAWPPEPVANAADNSNSRRRIIRVGSTGTPSPCRVSQANSRPLPTPFPESPLRILQRVVPQRPRQVDHSPHLRRADSHGSFIVATQNIKPRRISNLVGFVQNTRSTFLTSMPISFSTSYTVWI